MSRFDVYPMPDDGIGYIVDVQADLLDALTTRTVIPLLPEGHAPRPIADLNPVFTIGDGRHVLITQALASISRHALKSRIGTLADERDRITRALDTLLTGF